jgi:hypothetical protein
MEENKRSIEAALFIEISDDENSIEVVSSPRLSQKGGLRRSSSIRSQVKDVKFKNPAPSSTVGDDLSVPSQWTELERYKKLKEAANTVIDTEFAELDAWIDNI